MGKNHSMFDDLNEAPPIWKKYWWKIEVFYESWIYPGPYLINFLFRNYNKVKLPMFKPYEYLDVSTRMEFVIFELIKEFIEREEPEKHICWYKDKEGNDLGHKYGEYKNSVDLYPTLNGKYIMDIIKDIYRFYTKVLPEMQKEKEYLLDIWCKYILNGHYEKVDGSEDFAEWVNEKSNYTLEDLEKENLNWNIILKYIEKKEDFFKENLIHSKVHELENLINNEIQHNLHLAIEVRPYLWT